MNPTTKAVIQVALENDSEVSATTAELILSALEGGKLPSVPAKPDCSLLTASAAAKRLNLSRTTFWRLVRWRKILPVEITPGVFRYQARDVDELANEKSHYRPRRRGVAKRVL